MEHGVRVRVVIGEVADISLLLEGDGERRCVVGLSTYASSGLRTPYKVVFVVADSSTNTVPERTTLHCFRHREHHRTHSWQYSHNDIGYLL